MIHTATARSNWHWICLPELKLSHEGAKPPCGNFAQAKRISSAEMLTLGSTDQILQQNARKVENVHVIRLCEVACLMADGGNVKLAKATVENGARLDRVFTAK